MNGGRMTISRFAIAAVATALMGSSALAADLGGNCCADLEERIAELEATTVRKGNRKVSVTLSGFVSHNVMWWDDGTQTDVYFGDGGNYGSRFRFVGTAKISPEVTAGFLYEFGANANSISSANQLNGGDDLGPSGAAQNAGLAYAGCGQNSNSANTIGCATVRDATVWLRHARLGMIKTGHGSTATDNLTLIDLGGTTGGATSDIALYPGGFILRSSTSLGNATNINWGQAIRGHESWDTSRRNHVLYETPTLMGFTLQAAVAEDNYWDIALRYAGEHHGFRTAWGIGYQEDTKFNGTFQLLDQAGALCNTRCDVKVTDLKGSSSVLHVATGLFLTSAWGQREIDGGSPGIAYNGQDLKFWYLSGGLRRNFFGIGDTVLFAEYSESKGGLAQANFLGTSSGCGTAALGFNDCSSKVTHWGLGVTQYIDAAAMEVFATYKNYEIDAVGFGAANATLNNGGANDISVFVIGSRINF